ncbi:hypothetical protein GW17_00027386 [Ensete ventricosum]|nr:hypothetical protein GW17_00027386 [Ensete ventricosum]
MTVARVKRVRSITWIPRRSIGHFVSRGGIRFAAERWDRPRVDPWRTKWQLAGGNRGGNGDGTRARPALFRPPLTATLLLSTSFWRERRPVGRARVETGLFDWRENRTCGVGFGAQSGSGFAILGGNIHSQRCLLKRAERARIYT